MNERPRPLEPYRDQDTRFVEHFFDPAALGPLLGQGFRSRVYGLETEIVLSDQTSMFEVTGDTFDTSLADRWVVKIPKLESRIPPSLPDKKKAAFTTASRRFGSFIPATFLLQHRDQYCILQEDISPFDNLTPATAQTVSDQLEAFATLHRRFVADDRLALELLGLEGFRKTSSAYVTGSEAELTNIVISRSADTPRLLVHDVTFFYLDSSKNVYSRHPLVHHLASLLGYRIMRRYIRDHFGMEIGV